MACLSLFLRADKSVFLDYSYCRQYGRSLLYCYFFPVRTCNCCSWFPTSLGQCSWHQRTTNQYGASPTTISKAVAVRGTGTITLPFSGFRSSRPVSQSTSFTAEVEREERLGYTQSATPSSVPRWLSTASWKTLGWPYRQTHQLLQGRTEHRHNTPL